MKTSPRRAAPRILVVGSSNTDMVIKLDHLPAPGETVLGGKFVTAAGGKGANQAVSAARAGGKVTFIARLGRDVFGAQALAGFKKEGINVEYVTQDKKEPSGVALIFVAKDGQNSIAVAGGANGRLSPRAVNRAKSAFKTADLVLMQLETPVATVHQTARLAAKEGIPVILNPAPARALPQALLKLISILTPNETEAEILTGLQVRDQNSAALAAERLLARGIQTVIVTLGAQGALVATKGLKRLVPGIRAKAVDCTAAGDVFNGALAVAIGEGRSLLEAVRFANAAAAISVTRLGAQPSAPHRAEIDRVLGKQKY